MSHIHFRSVNLRGKGDSGLLEKGRFQGNPFKKNNF